MITTRWFAAILIVVLTLVGLQNCAIKRFFSAKLTNQEAELWIKRKIKEDVDKYYTNAFRENKRSKRMSIFNLLDSLSLDSIRCTEIHQATYYECNLEKNNILQLSMTKDLDNCLEQPASFQYLKLKKYAVTPFQHGTEDFYVFAVYQQPTQTSDTTIQNFFIGKRATFNNLDYIHFYKKVYYSKSLNDYKGISLDFYLRENATGNKSIAIDRIIDRSFNKIGGSKPLVYDLKKLFSEAGLVLEKVKN
jgi:hypothetical protein